jgi:nucleoid-associated protein YgaU
MTGSNQHRPDDDGLPMPGEPLTKVEPAGKAKKLPKSEKKKAATATPAKKTEKKDNRGGRTSGSRNFNAEDMVRLVKIVGEVLPLGQTGWSTVEKQFNENSHLRRDHKSLKAKFDAVSAVAY